MKTIAVYGHKGGIGKTVTAVNFGYNLSQKGHRVLVADMDPQGNASAFFRKYDLNKPSMKELLTGVQIPSRCVRRTAFRNLDIIPANINLREVTVGSLIGGVDTLKNALWALNVKYDYCIIDCPPSVDFLIEVIMAAADEVIVPMKPDRFSVDGLGTVVDVIDEFGGSGVPVGCLFTQFYRNKDTVKAVGMVGNMDRIFVYENAIRRCSAVDHSIYVRRPLAKCASKSTAACDYKDFVDEYLKKEGIEDGAVKQLG